MTQLYDGCVPIMTPPPLKTPRLNGARVVGVRSGSPFLHALAATGDRPMTFSAIGLPTGLRLDSVTGIITGTVSTRGACDVTVGAANSHGKTERTLRIMVGDAISLTPPMGFNTYGGWGPFVTETDIRAGAQALVKSGLSQHGYCYVNIDDGWQGRRGGKENAIQPNDKFGDMRSLCDDLHALGFKAGIYSTPWASTYEGFIGGSSDAVDGAWISPDPPRSGIGKFGSHCFAIEDARQWAAWGFDYCKYDWGIDSLARAQYMRDALDATGRDFVLELSNAAPFAQAADYTAIGNMCRTTTDITDVWDRKQLPASQRDFGAMGIYDIWMRHRDWAPFNRPGHWNMPCPLRVGLLGGWDLKPLTPTRLTPAEQYSHISLWCLWSAPLIIGCPVERLDSFTLSLLNNDEVLDLDQDSLGQQARQLAPDSPDILVKELWDGSKAVGLFNTSDTEDELTVSWSDLGITGPHTIRDLWRQTDIGVSDTRFSARIMAHGVVLIRLSDIDTTSAKHANPGSFA
ncbi:MAG: putative Ig domain-containing protein [bacterium]